MVKKKEKEKMQGVSMGDEVLKAPVNEKGVMKSTYADLNRRPLSKILEKFWIPSRFRPSPPNPRLTIDKIPRSHVGVYYQFMLAGLRFPAFPFLGEVLNHYKIHISQVSPNGFRKIICFAMLCESIGISPDISIFRHFYCTMASDDWLAFSRHVGCKELC